MSRAYYNEIDQFAAQTLRNLIAAGHIAPGDVDTRSIKDVTPNDLRHYTQCHFFAGIGVWSYALRRAGIPDNFPVWTGSCPCQPFSAAGKGDGFDDQRHLWPDWEYLIRECAPFLVYGEQVASIDGLNWLDLVHTDMEAQGYAFTANDLCAAGFGAPHIRQRSFFMAVAEYGRRAAWQSKRQRAGAALPPGLADELGRMGNTHHQGLSHRQLEALVRTWRWLEGGTVEQSGRTPGGLADSNGVTCDEGCADLRGWIDRGDAQSRPGPGRCSLPNRVANDILQQRSDGEPGLGIVDDKGRRLESSAAPAGLRSDLRTHPLDGPWRDADWLLCRDGKWRPVEPGTFPLANGVAGRVGQLRAYGNAIVAEVATAFIRDTVCAIHDIYTDDGIL